MIEELLKKTYPNLSFQNPVTFYIGFINPNMSYWEENGMANDETVLTAESPEDLSELYDVFCAESGIPSDTAVYLEVAEND